MSILRTFINFDCHYFNYLHIQFSIPISIQVAPASCHRVRRKAKSRKALKLNDINNSDHAAVHHTMSLDYIQIMPINIYKYIYTRLHNFPMLVKHKSFPNPIPPLILFHIHHFANCQFSPLILDDKSSNYEDSHGKC